MASKFLLGEVVVTPRASEALEAWGQSADRLLARHQSGDWGDVSETERRINDEGLSTNVNLVSTYVTPSGEILSVFTKGDRSYTLVHVVPQTECARVART